MLDAAEAWQYPPLYSGPARAHTSTCSGLQPTGVGRRAGCRSRKWPSTAARLLERAIAAGGGIVASWFGSEAKYLPSAPLYVPDSDMTFRPDRVLVRPRRNHGCGRLQNSRRKRAANALFKVQNYLHLLKALGHENVCGYLWYPCSALWRRYEGCHKLSENYIYNKRWRWRWRRRLVGYVKEFKRLSKIYITLLLRGLVSVFLFALQSRSYSYAPSSQTKSPSDNPSQNLYNINLDNL